MKDAVVTVTQPSGTTVDVRTDTTGRYETPCFESGSYNVTVGDGVTLSAIPTNGPRIRMAALSGTPVSLDFGFSVADVKGVNIGAVEAAVDLAYTGSDVSALLALSILMIVAGLVLMRQRRRFLRS